MAAQVRGIFWYHDEMSDPDVDEMGATGTQILLAGGIRLHHRDDLYPQRAHARTPTMTTRAATTTTMSNRSRSCDRNGLKPIA
jgi:hypothetical protein